MRSQLKRVIVAIGTVVAVATLWSATTRSVVGQSLPAGYKAPRTADGAPDLNGFWQAVNTANWNLEEHGTAPAPYQNLVGEYLAQPAGLSVVEGGAIPYKPEALAKRNKYRQNRLNPDALLSENGRYDGSDPEAKCFQGGVPRATYIGFPFQIIQTKNKILIAYEYAGSARIVHLDQPRSALLNIETWMGQSVGKWEGDTLVVDAQWFSNDVWLDRSGNFYGPLAHITERFTPASPFHLNYEATIEDPDVFTRPWKISMPLYRRVDPRMQLLEFQCIPLGEEYLLGKLVKKPK